MRIKYNMKDQHFKCYNEANGVALVKKKLKRKPKKRISTYLGKISLYGVIAILICVAVMIAARIYESKTLLRFSQIMLWYSIIIFGFSVISLYFSYRQTAKTNGLEGSLSIVKKGIIDNTRENKIELAYDTIELVAITKHAIVFILKTPFMLYIDNKEKEKVVKALKKYSDVLIIDNND